MKSKLDDVLLDINSSLDIALNKLNQEGIRVLFLTEEGKLKAVITSGDIRRALLRGGTNKSTLKEFAKADPIFVREGASPEEIYKLFGQGIDLIPVVDSKDFVIDVISRGERSTIPISEPNLTARESELVNEALNSKWISSTGLFVAQFENMFREYTNAEFSLSVCNGTQAICLALNTLGIGLGDEVIVPSLTFGATANAVIQVGAIPVFVDVEDASFGIDPEKIQSVVTERTKAILIVHLYGKPAKFEEISKVAAKNNLLIIEDCAEALGTKYGDEHVGTQSDAGTFSFFANKTITTGEGGMVTFRSKAHFEKAKLIRSHGFDPAKRYWHTEWGTNYRLTNLQAAVGVGQMERIDSLVARKSEIASKYEGFFEELKFEQLVKSDPTSWGTDSHWLHTVLFKEKINIEALISFLAKERIESRRIFIPLTNQPAFKQFNSGPNQYPVSNKLFETGICLPSSTTISDVEIFRVAEALVDFFERQKL